MPRVIFVAVDDDSLAGFVAGHLTRRHGCAGELQWIDVVPQWRGSGVASELLRQMASWFVELNAGRICVNVDPANARARRFYQRHGFLDLPQPERRMFVPVVTALRYFSPGAE